MAKKPFKRRTNYDTKKNPRKSLWTPSLGITQTGLSKFMTCPEQFALSYIEGVTSKKISVPLEFGNLFHLCLEFQGNESPELVAKRCCDAYLKTRGSSVDSSEYEKLQQLVGTVQVVFPLYVKNWQKKDKEIKWIGREVVFKVPYTFTRENGQQATIYLTGKRDGLYQSLRTKKICLFETKTKSQIDAAEIRDGLRADFQTLFYLLSYKIDTGIEPSEVLYNVIRRPGQKYLKSDTLKTYLARIEADIKKRPDHYFARWHVTLTKGSLDTFCKVTLDPTLRDLARWWESIEKHPFDRWKSPFHQVRLPALVNGRYGRSDLYEYMIRGNKAPYYNRKILFPELNDSIQIST